MPSALFRVATGTAAIVAGLVLTGDLTAQPVPIISISGETVSERDSGSIVARFTVQLSASSLQTVSVSFTTSNGTATAGTDYTAASGTLTLAPGMTKSLIYVTVFGDTEQEPDEYFFVYLSNPTGGIIGLGRAAATIDDDDFLVVRIGDTTIREGDAGTTNAILSVTLSRSNSLPVSASYRTWDSTAKAGSDYVATNGVLNFAPGVTNLTLSVAVNGDFDVESDEAFQVTLISATNAVTGATGTIAIMDDDRPPSLTVSDAFRTEGNAGVGNAVFTVGLSAASGRTVQMSYSTSDGTAQAGSDYVAQTGAISFPPGATNRILSVMVTGDLFPETNETFFVNFSSVSNAVLKRPQAVGFIVDDESPASNDLFANRATLVGSEVTIASRNNTATTEAGEPAHAGKAGGKSLWWTWTAPNFGAVRVSTKGSDFNTLLAAYVGDSLATLAPVASNDNDGTALTSRLSFNCIPGQTYQLVVDGADGSDGTIVLSLNFDSDNMLLSSVPRDDFWVPDGPVFALAETNGILYLGGAFSHLRRGKETALMLNVDSREVDLQFPQVRSPEIRAVVPDGKGGWFIGGRFTRVGEVAITNLVHIRPDRTVDTAWTPNPVGQGSADEFSVSSVLALAVAGDRLLMGGNFLNVGGAERRNLAALDAATGAVLEWHVSTDMPVLSLAVLDNTLYVGGYFFTIGGRDQSGLAAVDIERGVLMDWRPSEEFSGVEAMVVSCDTLYVGGYGGGGPFAYDAATGQRVPRIPEVEGAALALALVRDTLFIGGEFTSIAGEARTNLAAVNVATGQPASWNPNPDAPVSTLITDGSRVYVGGSFTTIGGQSHPCLAILDPASGAVDAWSISLSGTVTALGVSGNILYVGGAVVNSGAKPRQNLAALDARTGIPTEWNPGADGFVRALAVTGDRIYAGGSFTNVGGQPRSRVAALDRTSGHATAWNPGANSDVYALAVAGNTVYLGGGFTNISGQPRKYLAAVDGQTGQTTLWNPNPNSYVFALAASEDTIFAGGGFSYIGLQPQAGLAALDTLSGLARPVTYPARRVNCIALQGTAAYVVGDFKGFVWDTVENREVCTFPVNESSAVVVPFADLVYAGDPSGLFAHDIRTCERTDWRAEIEVFAAYDGTSVGFAAIFALSQANGRLYAGGDFGFVQNQVQPGLAAFFPEGSPVILQRPKAYTGPVGQEMRLSVVASGHPPLAYQWQRGGTNLMGETNSTLRIQTAQLQDAGTYAVIVTNALGLLRSEDAPATIFVPPQILNQPIAQTVSPGGMVTLSVLASASPPPRYQWRLNGVNIPGAIGSTLTVPNAQPTNGGSYSVVVANIGGAIESEAATLRVLSPALPFADKLADGGGISGQSGVGSGSNVGATKEAGETNHVGKLGGSSAWLKWLAPANGIATFSTRGSSFDTLLAIYTGTNVANLTLVAADEDRGGFLTSQASFNAVAGTEYRIAVDGFAGATGSIVLSWNLDTTTVPFPRIITQPLSLAVFAGQTAAFSVEVNSTTPATYQWFRGCRPIPGATSAMFALANVQRADVGAYHVVVMNASSRVAESFEAFLEIGPEPKIVSQDKVEDLFPELLGPSGLFSLASIPNGFLSVSLGTIDSQLLDNSGATTSPAEPIHCGVLGGSSKWLRLRPLINATFLVDTMGSRIRTVLAVYRETNLLNLAAGYVTCDLSSAPDGHSLVRFNATANTDYLVAVDGMNGAQGLISLNWKLGLAPGVLPPASGTPTVRNGESTVLQVTVTNIFGATYQWRWKGQNIFGATNHTLSIPLVSRDTAGQYSIVASNFAGMTTNFLNLLVELPYLRSWPTLMNGSYRLLLPDTDAPPFILQTSSDLTNWSSLYSIGPSNTVPHLDLPATNSLPRYFRAQPWP